MLRLFFGLQILKLQLVSCFNPLHVFPGIIIPFLATSSQSTINFQPSLVGGIPTPLKNILVSWDYDIPNMMGKSFKIPWFQSPPTRSTSNHQLPTATQVLLSCRPFLNCLPFRGRNDVMRKHGPAPQRYRSTRSTLPQRGRHRGVLEQGGMEKKGLSKILLVLSREWMGMGEWDYH